MIVNTVFHFSVIFCGYSLEKFFTVGSSKCMKLIVKSKELYSQQGTGSILVKYP